MSAPASALGKRTLVGLLRPYLLWVLLLALLAVCSNAFGLAIPFIIARGIDAYGQGTVELGTVAFEFSLAAAAVFVFTYAQSMAQTYASELVARDLRGEISAKISKQSYAFVRAVTPAKLLTNLTTDVDSVKTFVSMGIVTMVSSAFLIVGAGGLLLFINWRLALAVLATLPIILAAFFVIFSKIRTLFKKTQEVIDRLNNVINESILGSALIRVLNSRQYEYEKFLAANADAKNIGLQILRLFASLIPVITFVTNLATLIILTLGGHFVIGGSMTLGEFAAFNSYLAMLIFPIIMIGFMSNLIARSSASYQRIAEVLDSEERPETGTDVSPLLGDIEVRDVSLFFGEKAALKHVSFSMRARTRTAVIGPTGAGKTQLLHLLTGLMPPSSGAILYDGKPLESYESSALHRQIGFVFEDGVVFNMTLRENIAFGGTASEADVRKAMETAELQEFIASLPNKEETVVSERGTNLSGGQKQRIMLARALALNPKVLLLDDFTARVDTQTERSILLNLERNYPAMTVVSVTQKIASAERFDHIVLLMEGELLAQGTHAELLEKSPEYVQIAASQRTVQ